MPYFLVTFTLPAQLRALARQHQRRSTALLFRSSATALQQLAADPRFLGGQIGMVGVLADLDARPALPSAHPLPGAGRGASRRLTPRWLPAKGRFLVHVKPLAKLFRGKVRAALRQLRLETEVAERDVEHSLGGGLPAGGEWAAALKYLAPYVFRVALSNNRIDSVANDQVTFRYRVARHEEDATLHAAGRGVHPSLSAACAAQRLRESPLLRAVQPRQAARSWRRCGRCWRRQQRARGTRCHAGVVDRCSAARACHRSLSGLRGSDAAHAGAHADQSQSTRTSWVRSERPTGASSRGSAGTNPVPRLRLSSDGIRAREAHDGRGHAAASDGRTSAWLGYPAGWAGRRHRH